MALAAATIWEVRTTGSDTACSGGFNPQNTNMATDGAATDANTSAPVFTSASYNFVAGDVGAWLFIKSGTNWTPGWYQIASVAANAATLTATIGTAQLYGGSIGTTNGALTFIPSTVVGCATTASPTGATWSVDYSQQAAAQFAYTDMVIDAGTNTRYTSAALPVGKNCVGNLIKITSGTGFTVQTNEIVSVSGVIATTDKSLGTLGSTGGNGYLGGCYAGPQLLLTSGGLGQRVFIKSGTYTISSATPSITNGVIVVGYSVRVEGYGSTRGDLGTAPVFQVSGIDTVNVIAANISNVCLFNLKVDANNRTSINCFTTTSQMAICVSCIAINASVTGNGFTQSSNNIHAVSCYAENCTTGFANTVKGVFCVAKSCTTGFILNGSTMQLHWCIATGCTTGFSATSFPSYYNCIAYNGTTGFTVNNNPTYYYRCISSTNTTGFAVTAGGTANLYQSCASYNDGTPFNYAGTGFFQNFNFQTLAADPFVSAAGGNFALNNTSTGGALLQGISQAFPSIISSTTYPDIGAIQNRKTTVGGGF